MNYTGDVFDSKDLDLWEPDYQLERALVTEDKMLLDWHEGDNFFSSRLTSTDGGYTYEGIFGAPVANEDWEIKAYRYSAPNGEVALLIQWQQHDHGWDGCCVVRLKPQSEIPQREAAPTKSKRRKPKTARSS